MNTQSIEIVIAKYQEDVSWADSLNPLIKKTIYDKGDPKSDNALPNVGRESHTYLHHISSQYDNLSDLTIFSQGASHEDINPSRPDIFIHMINTLAGSLSLLLKKDGFYMDLAPAITTMSIEACWEMDSIYKNLGEFFNHLFGFIPEDKEYLCRAHAVFAVQKKNILKRPQSFYQQALDSLMHSSCPQEAHFMERLWKTILASPSCYDAAQKPGEWRTVSEVSGKIIKKPILLPYEEEIKKSLFITETS